MEDRLQLQRRVAPDAKAANKNTQPRANWGAYWPT